MPQLVILGWDALDAELIQQYGLGPEFGTVDTIETYSNPFVGEPHTLELWPSMITGVHADEHGLHAATGDEGVDWDNPYINFVSNLSAGIIPKDIRTVIGRYLRKRTDIQCTPADYYNENNVPTVFDNGGRAISIPNYQTEFDRRHELDAVRNDVWGELLPDRSGEDGIEPQVELETVWEVLTREAGRRLGHTIAAIQDGHDVVWTWFGILDSIGHIQPAIDSDLSEPGYRLAASMTRLIRDTAPDDATVVAISDHGLQDGTHTDYATLAATDPTVHDAINGVLDVAEWVEDTRSRQEATSHGYQSGSVGEMTEQLEALGYV